MRLNCHLMIDASQYVDAFFSHLLHAAKILPKLISSQIQTVALARPGVDLSQPCQRLVANSLPPSSMPPAPVATPASSHPVSHPVGLGRPAGSSTTPAAQSKLTGANTNPLLKMSGLGQTNSAQPAQDSSQDKQAEQAKLVRAVGHFWEVLSYTWIKFIMVLDSNTFQDVFLSMSGVLEPMKYFQNSSFWSALLAYLPQAISLGHRKVFESFGGAIIGGHHWCFRPAL